MKKIILSSIVLSVSTLLSANSLCCNKKMCERGDGRSCYELASSYENSWNTGKGKSSCDSLQALYSYSNCSDFTTKGDNYRKAIKLYKRSISLGYTKGYDALGVLYVKGKGVPKSITKAKQLFYKSCMSGNENGCYNYALLQRGKY